MRTEEIQLKDDQTRAVPQIIVMIPGKDSHSEQRFSKTFRIGRDETCEIRLTDGEVSRFHAEIYTENGCWWVRDLNSTNGTFIDGKRIERAPLKDEALVEIGIEGPKLTVTVDEKSAEEKTTPKKPLSVTQYFHHYFDSSEEAGEHTMMIRRAFKFAQKKHSRKYFIIIASISVLLICAGFYLVHQSREIREQKKIAGQIFYAMKDLEIELARRAKEAFAISDSLGKKELKKIQPQQKDLIDNYNKFLKQIDFYGANLSTEDSLIFAVARIFGECEVTMPHQFVKEVKNYIKKWQSTPRLSDAIQHAVRMDYPYIVSRALLEYDLPPQLFFMALQESDFDVSKCGPQTRWGIAKGAWQFIPSTASLYGLRIGPLYHLARFDPRDERHDFKKATKAAVKYLHDLYSEKAQASGLLVMASYNWGQTNITGLVEKMPPNPRDRNFWRLLMDYRDQIPEETYNYVFYIVSAAVIGENPRFFGFNFDNPLANAIERCLSE